MAAQTLRTALLKAENSHPGITLDLILGIIQRAELNLDMNESVLRLQGAASDYDGTISFLLNKIYIIKYWHKIDLIYFFITIVVEYRSARSEDAFQELNRKSTSLKRILSRIPDEITDRKTFLETIKYELSFMNFTSSMILYYQFLMFVLEKLQVR